MKKIMMIAVLLVAGISTYAQKTNLALNLTQGNTYYMTTTTKMLISEVINGNKQDVTTTISAKIAHKILAVADTTYEMEIRYQRIDMKVESGGQSVDFNSDGKEKSMFANLMASIVNKPFTITLNKRGKVRSIKNIENLYSTMFDSIPNLSEGQKAQAKNQMQQAFGAENFKGNIESAFAVFPPTKVAKSDKWAVVTNMEMMVPAQETFAYVLQDVTDNAYQIHGDGVIQLAPGADFKEMNGVPMKFINLAGTSTAELKLDKKTGWIAEAKISKQIKGSVQVKDNPKVPGGMTFPITATGETSIAGNE